MLYPFRHLRLLIVFIHQRDIVEDVFLGMVHATHAVMNDHCQFIGISGIVGDAVRDRAASRLWPSWCCRPSPVSVVLPAVPPIRNPLACMSPAAQAQITDALETKHRVIDIERNHECHDLCRQ